MHLSMMKPHCAKRPPSKRPENKEDMRKQCLCAVSVCVCAAHSQTFRSPRTCMYSAIALLGMTAGACATVVAEMAGTSHLQSLELLKCSTNPVCFEYFTSTLETDF